MRQSARDEAKTELQMQLTDKKASALKKYQQMVIGKTGLFSLFKYEFITLICNSCPGALGYMLRKKLYPILLGSVGRGTVFGRNMTIRHPHKIHIGEQCVIDDLVVLDAKGESNNGIKLGNSVIIARNTVLSCKGGDIEIGDNSNISLNCMIHSEKSVKIGARNLWAAYCYVIGGGRHDFNRTDMPIIQQGSQVDGIVMEENLWLGAFVKVLDGCRIGSGCVIGAGSLVNKDIPANKIIAGSPARILKNRSVTKTPEDSSNTPEESA